MKNLQKIGGVSAVLAGVAFVIGFALYLTKMDAAQYGNLDVDVSQHITFLVENAPIWYAWNLIIYVAFGIFMVALSLALFERLKQGANAFAQIGLAFGLIWSVLVIGSGMVANVGAAMVIELADKLPEQAEAAWIAMAFVTDGLGGGNEIVGGIWVLLVSLAGLQSGQLPKSLNYFGAICGIAGLVSTIPTLADVGAIFGLGLIFWYIWAGVILFRGANDVQSA